MGNDQKDQGAEIVSIMSRNSAIAYRIYKQKFNDAMEEYRIWKKDVRGEYASVIEGYSLAQGYELRQEAEMWLGVCLKLKEHMHNKKMMCL